MSWSYTSQVHAVKPPVHIFPLVSVWVLSSLDIGLRGLWMRIDDLDASPEESSDHVCIPGFPTSDRDPFVARADAWLPPTLIASRTRQQREAAYGHPMPALIFMGRNPQKICTTKKITPPPDAALSRSLSQ